MTILLVYLLIINLFSFSLMGYDKSQARNSGQRVPEKQLFLTAAIGGGIGAWIGMRKFRHKTKHFSFVLGIPALIIINIACIYYLILNVL